MNLLLQQCKSTRSLKHTQKIAHLLFNSMTATVYEDTHAWMFTPLKNQKMTDKFAEYL